MLGAIALFSVIHFFTLWANCGKLFLELEIVDNLGYQPCFPLHLPSEKEARRHLFPFAHRGFPHIPIPGIVRKGFTAKLPSFPMWKAS